MANPNLNIDEAESNHSQESSISQKPKPRRWTSGNFEVIEVFEDDMQLDEWFNSTGGGATDWVIECNRETRTHHVTEYICRLSNKYSKRRLSDSPYNCQARLRVRKPLTADMDQSVIVEKTAADHDHEPKSDIGINTDEEMASRSTSVDNREEHPKLDFSTIKQNSSDETVQGDKHSDFIAEDKQIADNPIPDILPTVRQIIKEKTILGWNIRKIQNFLMGEKLPIPPTQQLNELMLEYEINSADAIGDNLLHLLDKKKVADDKINECSQKVSQLGKEIAEGFQQQQHEEANESVSVKSEANTEEIKEKSPIEGGKAEIEQQQLANDEDDKEVQKVEMEQKLENDAIVQNSVKSEPDAGNAINQFENTHNQPIQQQEVMNSLSTSRPKRNRTRRLYSPSPPPRLGGEPKRKKEQSEDSIKETVPSSLSLQNLLGKKILWAKEPPRHSSSEITTVQSSSTSGASLKDKSQLLTPSSGGSLKLGSTGPSLFARSTPALSSHSKDASILQMNERLAQEIAQLKRINQEQHQQNQALINVNRELIWAFNESRREHAELMAQLRALTSDPNLMKFGNGNRTTVPTPKAPLRIQRSLAVAPNVTESQPRRGKKRDRDMFLPANPSSLATHSHQPRRVASASRKTQSRDNSNEQKKSANELLMDSVKKEISLQGREKILIGGDADVKPKKLTREEDLEKIKQRLANLPTIADPETIKLLGQRRPAFYTPKGFGDWHSVVSGDLRKQIIFQIFQALCPEFHQKSIEEYLKAYPSRVDYIRNSVEFAFTTENELFVKAESRDGYFQAIAEKIYTLFEAQQKYSDVDKGGSKEEREKRTNAKRSLSDLLKPKRSRTLDDVLQ